MSGSNRPSKSINAQSQARNGQNPTPATRPIIGIDPGSPLAVAVWQPGRSPALHLLTKGASWRAPLEPYLPAHVFLEAPMGGNDALRDPIARHVDLMTKELSPFNRERQLIPASVWRLEVLGSGVASKQHAIDWATNKYPKVYGGLPFVSEDLAEALAVMEYGRRVVTNRLRHSPPGQGAPDYNLTPSRPDTSYPPKWMFDRDREGLEMLRDRETWPDPPTPPWQSIRQYGGERLAGTVRVWAALYRAVTDHCEGGTWPFSNRSVATDARVRPADVTGHIAALVDAALIYIDAQTHVIRPVVADTIWHSYDDDEERRRYNLFAPLFLPYIADGKRNRAIRKRWAEGTGDPPLAPSHWARKSWRVKHDARWGAAQCEGCGTFAVVAGEDFCDFCLAGQDRWAEQDARNPAHGEPDHEDDGKCDPCDADEAQFQRDNADDDADGPLTEEQQDNLYLEAEARERERAAP